MGQLVCAGLTLVLAGCLGFMMDPIRTWKSAIGLLTLLYVYNAGNYLLFIMARPDRLDLSGMVGVLAGLCCAVACVEVAVSQVKGRSVNWALARAALTACAILSVVLSARIIPYLFRSLSLAFTVLVSLATSLGPPCCLAAATWVAGGAPGSRPQGMDNAVPKEDS